LFLIKDSRVKKIKSALSNGFSFSAALRIVLTFIFVLSFSLPRHSRPKEKERDAKGTP